MFYATGGDAGLAVRAARLMVEAHAGQVRDAIDTPFHVHPFRVADAVADAVGLLGRPLLEPHSAGEVVAAALVHDVLEDVPGERREEWAGRIERELGPNVLSLARALRNPSKDLPANTPRRRKKELDRQHYADPALSPAARLIKLADRADNVADMSGWRPQRVRGYLLESAALGDAIAAGLLTSEPFRNFGAVASQAAFEGPLQRFRHALDRAWAALAGGGIVFGPTDPPPGTVIWYVASNSHGAVARSGVVARSRDVGYVELVTGGVCAPYPSLEALRTDVPDATVDAPVAPPS